MNDANSEILATLNKIYGLLELLAEDKIAQRDVKQRVALREIVGSSKPKQRSIFVMHGLMTQKQIHETTAVNRGHLSTMVGKLHKAKLLIGDTAKPHLAISIPANFFEQDVTNE